MSAYHLTNAILSEDSFAIVNIKLMKATCCETALVFAHLLSIEKYFRKEGTLTDDGFFFQTANQLTEKYGFKRKIIEKAQRELLELGFIETELRGLPAKTHYKINHEAVLEFFTTEDGEEPQPKKKEPKKKATKKDSEKKDLARAVDNSNLMENRNDGEKMTVKDVFEVWNDIAKECKDLKGATKLSASRRSKISSRIVDYPTVGDWKKVFKKIRENKNLQREPWFNIDFVMRNTEKIENILNDWMSWKYEDKSRKNNYKKNGFTASDDTPKPWLKGRTKK